MHRDDMQELAGDERRKVEVVRKVLGNLGEWVTKQNSTCGRVAEQRRSVYLR